MPEEVIKPPVTEEEVGSPPEGTQEATKPPETDAKPPEVEIDPESPFAPFAELRGKLIENGVDMGVLDTKFSSGEEFTDEDLAPIAQHGGYRLEDVKAYIKLASKNQEIAEKAKAHDESTAAAYLSELDTISGGSHKELLGYVADNASYAKVTSWQARLDTNNPDEQKAVLKEMQEYRLSKSTPTKGSANLDLLTKSNTSAPTIPTKAEEPPANPLEGNPFAGLNINQLCHFQLDPGLPDDKKALVNAVLKVKAPDLAR